MSVTEDKIYRQMTIQEIFSKYPAKAQKLAQELTRAGLNCVGCSASTWETLESGVLRHGYNEEVIEELLEKLNEILAEKVDYSTISMTKEAAEMFLSISEQEGKKGWGLRFDEEPAGCSGFEYVLGFSEKAEADDEIFLCHGVQIHVKKVSVPRLKGCQIGYKKGLQPGFIIDNPNSSSCCGCGSSHGYD